MIDRRHRRSRDRSNVIDDALARRHDHRDTRRRRATDPDTDVNVGARSRRERSEAAVVRRLVQRDRRRDQRASSTYTGTTKGPDTLFGDSTLSQLQNSLPSSRVSAASVRRRSLDLGISVDKTGVMSLDADKLGTALVANPNARRRSVRRPAGCRNDAQRSDRHVHRAGDGILTSKSSGLSDQSARSADSDRSDQQPTRTPCRRASRLSSTRSKQTMSKLQQPGVVRHEDPRRVTRRSSHVRPCRQHLPQGRSRLRAQDADRRASVRTIRPRRRRPRRTAIAARTSRARQPPSTMRLGSSSELRAALDHAKAPELCANLDSLYRFVIDKLTSRTRSSMRSRSTTRSA